MGTVFSIDIRDPGEWDDAVRDAVALLHDLDGVFTTYRRDSDLSRLRRGELDLSQCRPEVGRILELCAQVQAETGGYFSARWRDGIDPTGLVKGWAVERVSELLRSYGSRNHAVNGGGDVQTAGEAATGQPWRIGVVDPLDRGRILAVAVGRDFAVATSGSTERGAHIVNPFTGRPAQELASVTVIGRSLTRADAYATAAFAMGRPALSWLDRLPGCQGLLVEVAGTVRTSSRDRDAGGSLR